MNNRIEAMRSHIDQLNDAGVRRTLFYPLAYQSLQQSRGEPVQLRRARAQAYLLEEAPLELHPNELLAGSMTGLCPLMENPPSREEQRAEAVGIVEGYLRKKRDNGEPAGEGGAGIKTFEAEFTTKKSRWALMSRVHHDASITYGELQARIAEMQQRFAGEPGLEPYEIARELERGFKIHYGKEVREAIDSLPWFAANHLHLDYAAAVREGLDGIRERIRRGMAAAGPEQREYYRAAELVLDALVRFVTRHADLLEEAGSRETGPRGGELREMAAICRRVAHRPASTFREGVQLIWLIHLAASYLWSSALSFGRFDQYLRDLYLRDRERGEITKEEAKELLCCLWLKINEPKMRTVQSLTIGGITPGGEDAVNPLTELCLEVIQEMKLPYPNTGVRINAKNPDWIYDRVVESVKGGSGQPMIMNDDVWIAGLRELGYPEEIANDYYNMGCVEIMIPGKQPNWGVTDPIAFPMLFQQVFRKAGRGELELSTFSQFQEAYDNELVEAVRADKAEALEKRERYAGRCYDPFASLFIDGCLERGRDMFQGGSRLGAHWSVYAYGLGTAADAMAAVQKHVYRERTLTLEELGDLLARNFQGAEVQRLVLENKSPHFGNDDDEVDGLAADILSRFNEAVLACNDPGDPDRFVSTLFGYFFHIYHGEITGATPNGRRKGEPFSDSMGPSQGKDVGGPVCMLNSALSLDHHGVTGGYALNIKLNRELVKGKAGAANLKALLKTYIQRGGPQIQVNFVDAETLRQAKLEPEKHRNLIVRIGGYCEYFVNLDSALQEEIITRSIHAV